LKPIHQHLSPTLQGAAKVEPLQEGSRVGIAFPHDAVASSDPSHR
jgi:hypothetical protein